jgi:uncharacterized OsmC-like protein
MSIAEKVARASDYLTEHPDEARYRDSVAVAHAGENLLVTVRGPGEESVTTDMPTGIGGTATAPSPGWLLRAAAASCVASLIVIRAAATGIALRGVDVEVDSESDDRGILGLDDAIPAGALSMRVAVAIDAPAADPGARRDLARWALEHCPVTEGLGRAVPLELVIR